MVHESWVPSNFQNGYDIAVLVLKSPSTKQPIQLAPGDLPGFGAKLLAAGYGGNSGSRFSPSLQQADSLDYIPNDNCNRPEAYNGQIKDNMLCAMDLSGLQDACQGDSGGPLIIADINGRAQFDRLVGIVSFGPTPCGLGGVPGVYTRVSKFASWLKNTIENRPEQSTPLATPAIQATALTGVVNKVFLVLHVFLVLLMKCTTVSIMELFEFTNQLTNYQRRSMATLPDLKSKAQH